MLSRTRPSAILVPRRPNFASIFLNRHFAERSDIPLGAVHRIPQRCPKPTLLVLSGV